MRVAAGAWSGGASRWTKRLASATLRQLGHPGGLVHFSDDSTARGANRTAPVRAVLFDMDGTLIDTETQTDDAIEVVTARYGVPGFRLPHAETRGRTWMYVAETTRAQAGLVVSASELATAMLEFWSAAVREAPGIPGAAQAIRSAAQAGLRVAVVSSSPRSVIAHFVDKLGVNDCVPDAARIGADSVRRGKPDPEGFLLAARTLGAEPATSLVFEDSQAGLLAARAAGMRSMFITCCAAEIAENRRLATAAFTNYEALPARFWADLAAGTADLAAGAFA
jgi:HAD superfamily hydrolase (TIGR01509 family)